ncbi:transmembrane protein, putative [Medicago truncatula]|uniref:Transmembrane protein, putative n=1 Tax=Medicago truncatula TaxID=3880 RepID=A0A072U7Z7_MEDTR|nr:transmembrane protein, putative [Medicago truncatula]
MAMNKMKKSITLMMMMVMIMIVVTQVCDATQSIDISTKEYCRRCETNCCVGFHNYACVKQCMELECRCCVTGSPACAK